MIILCRFYFISDDELLSVLGSSDATSIQEHSLKLFDNCGSLKFARGNKVITGMVSSEVRWFSRLVHQIVIFLLATFSQQLHGCLNQICLQVP